MVYSLIQYQMKFYPQESVRTVQRMVQDGIIHSSHIARKLGHDYIIEVRSGIDIACEICDACIEFHKLKKEYQNDLELATKIAIERNLNRNHLLSVLGLKNLLE